LLLKVPASTGLASIAVAGFLLLVALCFPRAAAAQLMDDGVRIVYAFSDRPAANCEIELTRDSVRFLSEYRFLEAQAAGGGIEESAERRVFGRRALTDSERDSAVGLMSLTSRWKGYKRFICRGGGAAGEGYAFSLWSDSLLLACDNCFSCTEGVTLPEAKVLARFGRISLWLYGLREAWKPQ
jgi:hypothetical protein